MVVEAAEDGGEGNVALGRSTEPVLLEVLDCRSFCCLSANEEDHCSRLGSTGGLMLLLLLRGVESGTLVRCGVGASCCSSSYCNSCNS